jgi:phosphoserine phosphatase
VRAVLAGAASAAAAEVEDSLSVPPDPTAAAFFDVDNTMIRGASIYFFGKGMAGRGLITSKDLLRFGWQQLAFRVRGTEDLDAVAEARDKALGLVGRQVGRRDRGVRRGDLRRAHGAADLVRHPGAGPAAPRRRPAGVAGDRHAGRAGRIIAARLGLTGALGTVSEVEDGLYTGRLVGEPLHGPAKAEAGRALAEREGLDLSRCTAYSDSSNDVPMLSAVGHAVAVNPDTALRLEARARGWEVRDFRTGRKAAKVGVPAAAGAGALAGGVVAALALQRRRADRSLLRSFS